MRLIKTLFLLFTGCTFAQLDTTDYFPMHVGDRWQYTSRSGWGFSGTYLIPTDTTMSNGQNYFIRNLIVDGGITEIRYFRKVEDRFIMEYDTFNNTENKYIDMAAKKGDYWYFAPNNTIACWGIWDEGISNNNLTGQPLSYKLLSCVSKWPDTTIWCAETVDYYPIQLIKGLGIVSVSFPESYLYGAIINGVAYGTVSVEDGTEILTSHFSLSQNYPNPFNPETVIKFSLKEKSNVTLTVYNITGQKVAELVSGEMEKGLYEKRFNGISHSSGVYIFRLEAQSLESKTTYSKTVKAVLLK